jgi:RecB family exonuclease
MAPVWVITPGVIHAAAFRRRVAARGGAVGLHIGTFDHLFREILRRSGRSYPIMSEAVGLRLIGAVLQSALQDGSLGYFEPIANTPGFRRALQERFEELKHGLIRPQDLRDWVGSSQTGIQELADLYARTRERLRQMGWVDSGGLNEVACEALRADPSLMADIPLVVLDGFDAFNRAQERAIRLLGSAVPELILTLPGASGQRLAHRRFKKTLASLRSGMNCSLEYAQRQPELSGSLAHLEANLFRPEPRRMNAGDEVRMIAVRSPEAEAREGLRWLKARIKRDEVHMDRCALITQEPERYRPFLQETAREFGIPLRFTRGELLARSSSVAALLNLLELPIRNWPRRKLLELIRSPFFDLSDFGLQVSDAPVLEDVSLHGQVIEGLDQWGEVLHGLAEATMKPADLSDEDVALPNLPRGERAAEIDRSLGELGDRLSPSTRRSMRAWVAWLEDLLDDLDFFAALPEGREQAAGLTLREVLRGMVLGEDILGERLVTREAFVAELQAVAEVTTIEEPLDWRLPAVRVLSALEARGTRFDAVALLGLAEGIFPQVEREDPLLREELRGDLGLDPRLGREQEGLFYQAVTRGDRFLLITRPYMAEDGERWEPSPFWRSAADCFQGSELLLQSDSPRPLNDAASGSELLFWSVNAGGIPPLFEAAFRDEWQAILHGQRVLSSRQASRAKGVFEGDVEYLAASLGDRYGDGQMWSASRLETYGTCPFMFYVSSALDMDSREPPEPGFDPAQLGSMLHVILEKTYALAGDATDVEALLTQLQEVARAEFSIAPRRYGFRPNALWQVEQEQLLETLRESIEALEGLEAGWKPMAFEAEFGIGREPGLAIETPDDDLMLRGIIDRVDHDEAGRIRVIDYKTGSSHLSYRDLDSGRRLQLPLYALAAREALKLGEPVEGFYWIVRRAQAGPLRLSRYRPRVRGMDSSGTGAAIDVATQHAREYARRIRRGEFPPVPPEDGCPFYCPAAEWCWRFSPTRWNA